MPDKTHSTRRLSQQLEAQPNLVAQIPLFCQLAMQLQHPLWKGHLLWHSLQPCLIRAAGPCRAFRQHQPLCSRWFRYFIFSLEQSAKATLEATSAHWLTEGTLF